MQLDLSSGSSCTVAQYHHFERKDTDLNRWTAVQPGDLVHAPGQIAWRLGDYERFVLGDEDVKPLILAHKLLLVMSRIETQDESTLYVLSRHGVIVIKVMR